MAENSGLDDPLIFGKYMIMINSSPSVISQNKKTHYDTNEYGEGSVSVYKVLEGGTPSYGQVGHLVDVGGFMLSSKENKTLDEFLQEIRNGLSKIVSSGK